MLAPISTNPGTGTCTCIAACSGKREYAWPGATLGAMMMFRNSEVSIHCHVAMFFVRYQDTLFRTKLVRCNMI